MMCPLHWFDWIFAVIPNMAWVKEEERREPVVEMLSSLTRCSSEVIGVSLLLLFSSFPPSLLLCPSTCVDFCVFSSSLNWKDCLFGVYSFSQREWSINIFSITLSSCLYSLWLSRLASLFNIPATWYVEIIGGKQRRKKCHSNRLLCSTWMRLLWYFLIVHRHATTDI